MWGAMMIQYNISKINIICFLVFNICSVTATISYIDLFTLINTHVTKSRAQEKYYHTRTAWF